MKFRTLYILLFILANLLLRVTLCRDAACHVSPEYMLCTDGARSVSHQSNERQAGVFTFDRAIDALGIITEPTTPITVATQNLPRTNPSLAHPSCRDAACHVSPSTLRTTTNICKTSSHPHTLYYIFALHRMRN